MVDVRSPEVDGASDILFGFAEMPSFVFTSPGGLSSTVLSDPLFLWSATVGVEAWLVGLRTVDAEVLGLAGGLLSEPPTGASVAEEVVDGREAVDNLGVADLVTGFVVGCVCFALRAVASSFLSMTSRVERTLLQSGQIGLSSKIEGSVEYDCP